MKALVFSHQGWSGEKTRELPVGLIVNCCKSPSIASRLIVNEKDIQQWFVYDDDNTVIFDNTRRSLREQLKQKHKALARALELCGADKSFDDYIFAGACRGKFQGGEVVTVDEYTILNRIWNNLLLRGVIRYHKP